MSKSKDKLGSSVKKLKKPDRYLLVGETYEIPGHSPVYLRNVAGRKGGDWVIYACFKSKPTYASNNMKLNADQMREAKAMFDAGVMLKDIAPVFDVTPSCIGKILRSNSWL